MKALKIYLLASIGMLTVAKTEASNLTAIVNGNWSSPTTWSTGVAPGDNDNINIPASFTVTVDINSPTYVAMIIDVRGTLNFSNGQKINLDCEGQINVFASGALTGGNPGSKINICAATVWSGPGPTPGPVSWGTGPLPIELLSFSAAVSASSSAVELKWSTATETNNDFFTMERSSNGSNYEVIEKIDGAGNSTQRKDYSMVDSFPIEGTSYYRLKQTDFNGDYEYFSSIAVEYSKAGSGCILTVYPNPCTSDCTISLSGCDDDASPEIDIALMDAGGSKVFSKIPVRDQKGSFSFNIDSGNNLKPGVYIVRGVSKKENYTKKIIVK